MKPIHFFSLVALLIACNSETNSGNINDQRLSYRIFNYNNQTGDCNSESGACFKISYSYPEIETSNTELKSMFDAEMASIIQERLKDLLENPVSNDNTEELIQQLFREFNLLASEENEFYMKWNISIDCEVLYQVENMITIVVNHNTYMGGAHPDAFVNFRNYSLPNLERLEITDIVSDTSALKLVAEKIFRSTYQIPEESSFADQGYWFEDGEFYLPENFALTSSGLIFRFNPYEIGPYAIGAHEINVPYELIRSLLPKQVYQ